MKARLLQKLATGNSSIGKKTSRFTIFDGYKNATKEIYDFLIILQLPYLVRSNIFYSVKYFLDVCAHFSLKVATKDSFRNTKSQKNITSDAKILKVKTK